MDAHAYAPGFGGNGSAHAANSQKNLLGQGQFFSTGSHPGAPPAGLAINWPTQQEALGLFEFFKPATKKDVILLGEGVPVVVHHVKSKRHKVLCTASTGDCESCKECGTSLNVSDPQTEVHIPALRKEKDKRFYQCVAVFTKLQFEDLVEPLAMDEGLRGLRLEVHKVNPKTAEIKTVKGSPRSRAASLPEAFDLLPWVRGRWIRPQDPEHPPVRLEPVTIRDAERPAGRTLKPLALTASDRAGPEEIEAIKAKRAEMRERFLTPNAAPAVSPIDPPAPRPAAPATPPPAAPAPVPAAAAPVTPPQTEPAPSGFVAVVSTAPTPEPSPAPEPAPVSVTTPAPRRTLDQSIAAMNAIEAELPKAPPSTGMVPAPELAIAAHERYSSLRQANADGHAKEAQLREQAPKPEENRDHLRRRARNGEDLGTHRAVEAGGTFTSILGNIANGGAK